MRCTGARARQSVGLQDGLHDHCGASKDGGRSSSRLPIELPKRAARTGVMLPLHSPRSLAADVWEKQNTNSLQAGLHARRAGPRVSHDSPYPSINPRDVHSPPSHANNKNAESRAHRPNSRPPRRPYTSSTTMPRHEGLEHLRLRSPEGQAGRLARALQREEHGRRAVGARGVPGDLRDVSLVINTTTTLDTRVPPAVGSAPSAAAI